MADEGATWWNVWLQAAKEKTAETVEFLKRDLTEFKSTVQADGKKAISNVKENINQDNVSSATQRARAGVSSMLGGISKALTVEAEDLHPSSSKRTSAPSQPIFSRAKARLNAIQVDEGTYVNAPTGPPEEFEAWREQFQLDAHKGDISELLVANVEVRSLYTQLVPSAVSHADFWQRYFYKLHQLRMDEARREALKKRADDSAASLTWSDGDEDDDWVDMSGPSSPPSHASHMYLATAASTTQTPTAPPTESRIPTLAASTTQTPTAPPTESRIPTLADAQPSADDNNSSETTKKSAQCISDNGMDRYVVEETKANSNRGVTVKQTEPGVQDSSKTRGLTDGDSPHAALESSTDTLTTVTPVGPSVSSSMSEIADSQPTAADSSSSGLSGSDVVEVTLSSPELVSKEACEKEEVVIKTREKGDLVVVGSGSDRTSPSTTSDQKETDEDDWEREFEDGVTEEGLKLAQQSLAKTDLVGVEQDEDWEDWE